MRQMNHCQQCRADAVGKLKEDKSCDLDTLLTSEEPAKELIIAVATKQGALIDEHFGYASEFAIYRLSQERIEKLPGRKVHSYCKGPEVCDDDPIQEERSAAEALKDCSMVLSSRIGITPWKQLEENGITPNVDYAMLPIDAVLTQVQLEHWPQFNTAGVSEQEGRG